jgi:hypothetical protein
MNYCPASPTTQVSTDARCVDSEINVLRKWRPTVSDDCDVERDTVPAYKRPGFEINKHGVFYRNFEEIRTRVCDSVEVLAIVSNSSATRWGKLITFSNARNQQKHLVVPMRLLMSTPRRLAVELSSKGLRILSSNRSMSLLREYLTAENPTKNVVLNYRVSWNTSVFVEPPDDISYLKLEAF